MKRTRFRTSTSTWLLGLPNQICPTLRIVSPAIIRPIEPKFSIFGQSSTLLDYFRFLYNKTVSLKKTLICIFYQNEFWQFQGFPDKCQPVRSTWSCLNLWLISGRTWNWKSQNHPIFFNSDFYLACSWTSPCLVNPDRRIILSDYPCLFFSLSDFDFFQTFFSKYRLL